MGFKFSDPLLSSPVPCFLYCFASPLHIPHSFLLYVGAWNISVNLLPIKLITIKASVVSNSFCNNCLDSSMTYGFVEGALVKYLAGVKKV